MELFGINAKTLKDILERLMRDIKQNDLQERRHDVWAIVVEILGQVHECKHHNDEVDGKDHLRLIKHVVVENENDSQGYQHKELCVKEL